MKRVLITGSSNGLGVLAARLLVAQGHAVTLHGRNEDRAGRARQAVPGAEEVLVGDFQSLEQTLALIGRANQRGTYDAVIHNAGVGFRDPQRIETGDGFERTFSINVLAPYLLTAMLLRPQRLVFLSSGLHHAGTPAVLDPQWRSRPWDGLQAYSDSKLYDVVLAFAVARRWAGTFSNALEPGWVPTKLGGTAGPDDLTLAPVTQAWLAVSDDAQARTSGGYFFHQVARAAHPAASSAELQDELLAYCAALTGVPLPS
ncbi:MAG: putative oxidoreductase [Frankiales bacterium]|nr:putative oxidoreductase [Frankiales bacterium]